MKFEATFAAANVGVIVAAAVLAARRPLMVLLRRIGKPPEKLCKNHKVAYEWRNSFLGGKVGNDRIKHWKAGQGDAQAASSRGLDEAVFL
jgi:hypothetical protein